MSRHPYTYSADFIREIVGPDVSRSDASQLRKAIAKIIGIDDADLAAKISFAYMEKHGIEHND